MGRMVGSPACWLCSRGPEIRSDIVLRILPNKSFVPTCKVTSIDYALFRNFLSVTKRLYTDHNLYDCYAMIFINTMSLILFVFYSYRFINY